VDRQPVLGSPSGLFGNGGRGALGLGDGAGTLCFGSLLVSLAERVHANVFLSTLAYYLGWHMRWLLAPMLYDDDD
jgi:hypothetical protein